MSRKDTHDAEELKTIKDMTPKKEMEKDDFVHISPEEIKEQEKQAMKDELINECRKITSTLGKIQHFLTPDIYKPSEDLLHAARKILRLTGDQQPELRIINEKEENALVKRIAPYSSHTDSAEKEKSMDKKRELLMEVINEIKNPPTKGEEQKVQRGPKS